VNFYAKLCLDKFLF